ncbi:di/tricarboxylate transporter [Halorubrum alkaliphilum]|uniref:Di/tricarboxylate transporter n=2 Tax=Halorubrum alkaliphilum TaxID=261290 RepID=A0A8T4G9I1_9EURY|nr:di/tricarboxylate transporter [Halorubrum alkaliphilum]
MATVALAASFAFVLPVATAPNAIVFGSGYLTIPEMAKVGGAVSVTGTAVIVVGVVWWLPFVWG